MNRKKQVILCLVLLLALSVTSIGNGAYAHTESDPFITDLIAGQHYDVGDVSIWNDGTNLYVKYQTIANWYIVETHLHVAQTPEDIPQKNGNPIPGKFEYKGTHIPGVQSYLYTIPLDGWTTDTTLNIAAHAVVYEVHSINIESAPGIDAYGPVNTYYPVEDPNWGTAGTAVATWVHPSWPSISSAQWISTSYYLDSDGTVSSWRWFREEFYVPDDAIVLPSNVVWATSDNAEEVYLNGILIGSDGEVQGPYVDNQEWNTIKTYSFTAQNGPNSLDFIVRNYPGSASPTSNPTGIIYETCISYAFEETAWGDGADFPGKNWATYIEYAVQPDLLGDWIFVYHYGADYVHEMTITDQDSSTFSGTGKYPAGGPYTITWTVSGTYSGNTISFHIDYDSSSYYVEATGTINPVGTMNGPATAPGQTATWDAYRP